MTNQFSLIRTLSILQLLILSTVYCDSATSETVSVNLPKTVGSSINLEMTFRRVEQRKANSIADVSCMTPVRIEVLAVEPKQTVIAWTWGRSTLENKEALGENTAALLEPVIAVNEGVTLEIIFDAQCEVKGFRNQREVNEYLRKLLKVMHKATGKSEEESTTFVEQLENHLSDPKFQSLLLVEAGRYFAVYGNELKPGVAIEREVQIPNPFGGKDFPATQRYKLKSMDEINKYHVIDSSHRTDDEHVRRILQDAISQLHPRPVEPKSDIPKFTISHTGRVKVNRFTGWAEEVSSSTTIEFDEGSHKRSYFFKVAEK